MVGGFTRRITLPWCLDDLSTHKPTTPQFDRHYPSTQRTVCCDNLLLWHSDICTIRPGIIRPPRLWGGWFVTRNMTYTLPKRLCDIMSTLSWSEIWMVFHMIFGPVMFCPLFSEMWTFLSQDFFKHVCDVQPAFQQNVDILSHDFWTHLWCPTACSIKCRHFVAGFFDKCVCPPTHRSVCHVP